MKAMTTLIGTLAAIGAMGFAAPTQAATIYRVATNHASAACMGSLDVDRSMLHARSMGVSNETDAAISDVKCGGVSTPYNNGGDIILFEAVLKNATDVAIDVNCTLADGLQDGYTTVSTKYPKTVTIEAGQVAWIDWSGLDTGGDDWNTGANFVYPSLMCQLPTGVSISHTTVVYQEEIGQ